MQSRLTVPTFYRRSIDAEFASEVYLCTSVGKQEITEAIGSGYSGTNSARIMIADRIIIIIAIVVVAVFIDQLGDENDLRGFVRIAPRCWHRFLFSSCGSTNCSRRSARNSSHCCRFYCCYSHRHCYRIERGVGPAVSACQWLCRSHMNRPPKLEAASVNNIIQLRTVAAPNKTAEERRHMTVRNKWISTRTTPRTIIRNRTKNICTRPIIVLGCCYCQLSTVRCHSLPRDIIA